MSDAIDAALDGLSELAGCDLRLAKRFAARIEALPEDEDDKAMDLARSYQRMARSYRQTLVVQARLRRELKAEARADETDARAQRQARTYSLKAAIHAEIRPRIWTTEREDERCEELEGLLDDLIGDAAARLDFLDHTPETHVAAILEDLDLDGDAGGDEAEADLDLDAPDAASAAPHQGELSAQLAEGASSPAAGAEAPSTAHRAALPPGDSSLARPPSGRVGSPSPDGGGIEAAPPDPDPPPRPPDLSPEPPPAPYIPPWERLRPGQRFPGGSGW